MMILSKQARQFCLFATKLSFRLYAWLIKKKHAQKPFDLKQPAGDDSMTSENDSETAQESSTRRLQERRGVMISRFDCSSGGEMEK